MKRQFTVDDPVIKEAFGSIYKSSEKIYFRIDPVTQEHKTVNLSDILRGVGVTFDNIALLIPAYRFPVLAYESSLMKKKAAAQARSKDAKARLLEDNEENLSEEEISNSKRYSLTQQSNGYYGAWDEWEATEVLFTTQEEAIEHIHQLIHGEEVFRHVYAKVNFKQREPELQAVE